MIDKIINYLSAITTIINNINVSLTSSGKLAISMFLANSEISISNTGLEEQVAVELIYEISFDNDYVTSQELEEFVNNENVFLVLLILAIILIVALSGAVAGGTATAIAAGIAFLITRFN